MARSLPGGRLSLISILPSALICTQDCLLTLTLRSIGVGAESVFWSGAGVASDLGVAGADLSVARLVLPRSFGDVVGAADCGGVELPTAGVAGKFVAGTAGMVIFGTAFVGAGCGCCDARSAFFF